MERQEVEPLAKAPSQPVFDEVDNDEDDDEYKVESDADVDDTDSDDVDEQEVLPIEEVTLHLADIADDLLGGLEEPVLSDSECVESDAEDEDEEGCSGVAASQQEQQLPTVAVEGMGERAVERTPQQERPPRRAAGRRVRQAQSQQQMAEPADGVAAVPLPGGLSLEQFQSSGVAGSAQTWDVSLVPTVPATPLHHHLPTVCSAAIGGAGPLLLDVAGPLGDSAPLHGGHRPVRLQQTQAVQPCCANEFAAEQQELTLQQQLAAVTSLDNQTYFELGGGGGLAEGPTGMQQQVLQQQAPGPGNGQGAGGLPCPPSGGICRRTRAHVSLRDVDMAELEQQLPAHIDIEEMELAEDDEEYGKFLQALFDDTAALPEDSSDEDPDFAADLDLSKDDDDEDDRGWLKLLNSPDFEDGDSADGLGRSAADSPARRTRARSRRGNAKGNDAAPGASDSGEGEGAPEMTAEQRSILYAQVHCHTQLLVQTYAMFALDKDNEAQDHAAKAKALLEQLAVARDMHATTRRALGLASFTPDDLLRPPPPPPPPPAVAPAASTGGDKAASGAADSGVGGDKATTATSDAGGGRARPRAAATTSTLVCSEASRDDFDWENVDSALADAAAAAGVPAFKAAAAARSAAMGTAVRAFRPTWCPGPNSGGGLWSVLDVVPLRKFPEVQEIMRVLPALPYNIVQQQRELQIVAKSKRKNRRRRADDPLASALEWARPALLCLQGHLVVPLVYCPSPPVPPSYWTTAEDDLMMYGITRHGTNWRLIAETLLLSRNATQIANRYKNVNARGRAVDQVLQATEEGWPDPPQARGGPGGAAAGAGAPAGGRKPKAAPAPAPAARPQARAPAPAAVGAGVGKGVGGGLAAGPVAGRLAGGAGPAAALLQQAALPAVATAAAAALAPPNLPDVAAIVQAARLIGLPPAVTAAHILHTTQQQLLRAQPPPPPQVPLSLALQLVAQLQKPGGMTGPAAAAARLLATQLQEPSTAPAAVAALQRAAEQLTLQPPNVAAMAVPAAVAGSGVVGASTAGEQHGGLLLGGHGGGLTGGAGGTAEPSLLAVAAQLLQSGAAQLQPAALAAQLGLSHQVGLPVPALAGGAALPGMPAATTAALQQLLPALLSLAQPSAPGAAAAASALLGPAAAAAATAAGLQPWATRLPSDTSGGATPAAAAGVLDTMQQHALSASAAGLLIGHQLRTVDGGAAAPVPLGESPEPIDMPAPWKANGQAHDDHNDGPDEHMTWADLPPPSPGPIEVLPTHGVGGGAQYGGPAQPFVVPAAAAAAPAADPGAQQPPVTMPGWPQPHAHHPAAAAAPASVAGAAVAAKPEEAAATYTGPTDPRLAHARDQPALNGQSAPVQAPAAPPPAPPGTVSPDAHLMQLGPYHELGQHHQTQHPQQQDPNNPHHHELPSLSDNFTLGGLSDLFTHGGLKSGAVTPATCFSPQGGLASACVSHGHTMSLLLGSCLGLSALLRSDADGAAQGDGTPTKSAAAGPLRATNTAAASGGAGGTVHSRENGNSDHTGERQGAGVAVQPQAKTTADVGADAAVGRNPAVEAVGTPRKDPAPPLQDQQQQQPRPAAHQLFSPMSPTSAGGGAARNRLRTDGAAAPPARLAALRGGVNVTPSSDPKAKRRSRIGAATLAAAEVTARDTAADVTAPSPFEGTAQNDHQDGTGARACGGGAAAVGAAGPYRPRPPLFFDEGGGCGGNVGAAVAEGQPQQRSGEGLHGVGGVAARADQEDGDEGEVAAEGLARARKRLRLDVEDEEGVGGAAKAATPLRAAYRSSQLPGLEVGRMGAAGDLRGRCSVANSVAASPVRPTNAATRSNCGATAAAAAAAAAIAKAAAGKIADLLKSAQPTDSDEHQQQQVQQPQHSQHSTGTGSSGGSKRRSGSAATTPGASSKRVAVARGQAVGGAGAGAAAPTDEPGMHGTEAADVPAGPSTSLHAAVVAVTSGEAGGRQACRMTGQKRSRGGPGQKPARLERDRAQRGAATCLATEPLGVVNANASVAAVEAAAVAAGPGTAQEDSCCAIAGATAVPLGQRRHTLASGAAQTAVKGTVPGGTGTESAAAPTPAAAAKPPKAPSRRNATGAQRLTRASVAAAATAATTAHGRPPPPPSTRPQQASLPAGLAAAAPSPLQLSPPHRIMSPAMAAASELSCGALSLHSLLLGADTPDIASLLPSISSRSLAAFANPCSPPSHSRAATSGHAPLPTPRGAGATATPAAAATIAARSGAGGDAVQPPLAPMSFASPPHSQLLQLTPFAPSVCTLGTLDILPLFSGSSTDLWDAQLFGSAFGTTSRAPGVAAGAARVVAGSTAAADGDGGGAAASLLPPRASTLSDTTLLDPWSRFMAACSPASHTVAVAPLPPLPSSRHDFSLCAFHSHLFQGGGAAPPARTTAEADADAAATAAVVTATPTVSEVRPGRVDRTGGRVGDGGSDAAAAGPAADADSHAAKNGAPAPAGGAQAAIVVAVEQPRLQEASAVAGIATTAVPPDRPSACGDMGLRPAGTAAGAPGLIPQPLPSVQVGADARQETGAAAAEAAAELRSPTAAYVSQRWRSQQHDDQQNMHHNFGEVAVGPGKPSGGVGGAPAGGSLPPLPPSFTRHGPAPSPVAQVAPDSRPHAPETVRLFGRTVAKPLPIASPTMPAPSQLLRSAALGTEPAAAAAAAAAAAVRVLHLPAPDCPGQLRGLPGDGGGGGAAVEDNCNGRSGSQPQPGPGPGQQPDTAPQAPVAHACPPPLQTPAHGPARNDGGGASGSGGPLHRMLSPHDHGLGAATPGGTIDTSLLLAAAAGAPTPMQPPRAAAAAVQQTPVAVAPAGAFAMPDTHPNAVAVGAAVSLTPLLSLVETAAKTVGRRGPWDGRRPHAAPANHGPSMSHWASNEADLVHELAAPGTELLERQGSGCYRPGGGAGSSLNWRGARAAAHAATGAGGTTTAAETPGHFTCHSKVARRGVAAVAAVDPLVLPSPSVLQPTPRARLGEGDEAEGQEELEAAQHTSEEDEEDGQKEGVKGGHVHGEESGDGDADVGAEAVLGGSDEGDPAEDGQEADDSGDVEEEDQEEAHHQQLAGASPAQADRPACTVAAGAATGPSGGEEQAPGTAVVQPAAQHQAAAAVSLSWSKEQDQLVIREMFRLGEGPSTWKSISEQLGGGLWTVEAVEARGKQLMARMMALM